MKLTWRKQRNETGLARVCQGPRGYELWRNGKDVVMHVALRWRQDGGWYWYGAGANSYALPVPTPEEAKIAAKKWYLQSQEKP